MADVLDNAEFWLPSHFLTDDFDKENFGKSGGVYGSLCSKLYLPSDFPYGFDSFAPSPSLDSPVESVVSSTESDEEDLLADLTRKLARSALDDSHHKFPSPEEKWGLGGSPQSTLSALRSWSGSPNGPSQRSSPPTTPSGANCDPWDVIYAAAGQVARLKLGAEGPHYHHHHPCHQRRGSIYACSDDLLPLPVKKPVPELYRQQILAHSMSQANQLQSLRLGHAMKQQSSSSIWGRQAKEMEWLLQQQQIQSRGHCKENEVNGRCGRPLGLPPSAWPPLQQKQQQQQQQQQSRHGCAMRAAYMGCGSGGAKRESAGTGVFLPRIYGNPPHESCNKKHGGSTALFPSRVVHAFNMNLEEMNARPHPRFNNEAASDLEALMARRKAILFEQQRRSLRQDVAVSSEIRLPQEWTY